MRANGDRNNGDFVGCKGEGVRDNPVRYVVQRRGQIDESAIIQVSKQGLRVIVRARDIRGDGKKRSIKVFSLRQVGDLARHRVEGEGDTFFWIVVGDEVVIDGLIPTAARLIAGARTTDVEAPHLEARYGCVERGGFDDTDLGVVAPGDNSSADTGTEGNVVIVCGPTTIGVPPPAGIHSSVIEIEAGPAGWAHPATSFQETKGSNPIFTVIGDPGPGLTTVDGANFAR